MDDDCNGNNPNEPKPNQKTENHLLAIVKEKQGLSIDEYPIASRLLDEELQKTKLTNRATFDHRYIDLYNEKPVKVVAKVKFPTEINPSFNFVGKLLGPKGSTLKTLQENTHCRMLIAGRGSMRDKAKEESLRNGGDPKYAHLSDELHVEVSCIAPPSEAYHRIGNALRELREWLAPDPIIGDPYPSYPGEEMRPPRGSRPPPLVGNSDVRAMDFLEKARASMDFAPHPPRRPFMPPRGGFDNFPHGGPGDGGTWAQGGSFKRGGGPPRKEFFPPRKAPY